VQDGGRGFWLAVGVRDSGGIIGQRLDLHCPILRRQSTHAAAVARRLQFVILVVKLAFSRARSQGDAMVVIEDAHIPSDTFFIGSSSSPLEFSFGIA
jgi:hypothetical protein